MIAAVSRLGWLHVNLFGRRISDLVPEYSQGMAADLIVFGPHPDDIEIGLGASVACHSDAGYAVGLCDLTLAELSSNGTPEQRRIEADAAARVLGAAWRENLGGPTAESRRRPS